MKRESILRGQHLVVACLPQSLQRVNETNEVVFSHTVPWDLSDGSPTDVQIRYCCCPI